MSDREITIASTTATQEELDHAASEEWRTPPTVEEGEAGAKAENGSESDPEHRGRTEGKTESEESDADLPKGVKKRFDKLTLRAKNAEESLARTEARLRELEAGAKPNATEKKAVAEAGDEDPEPEVGKFQDYNEYLKAQARWAVRQETRDQQRKQAEEAENLSAQEKIAAHQERQAEAIEKYPDYQEKIEKCVLPWHANKPKEMDVARAFQLAIVDCDNGPDVMYHLTNHPEELARLGTLSSMGVAVAVGRISASLLPSATPKPKPASKAPKPITPVSGGSSSSTVPLGETDYQTFKRRRAAGEN
jgi:hypothetical protein